MGYKERMRRALDHKGGGKIPVDFGSSAVTGMHAIAVAKMREHYGLEKRPVKVHEPYQFLGMVEDDLAEAMGIDTIGVFPRATLFGFANENWKEFKTPWGQAVLVSKHFKTAPAPGGGLYIFPEGDTSVPASGHMPQSGYFFDTIIRQELIDEAALNFEDNLEEFTPVTREELKYFERELKQAAASSRSVFATFGGSALGDIALVPAPFLKQPKGIRDVTEWYMSTVTRQDYIHKIFARQTEIAIANLEKISKPAKDAVDAVFTCGTDFGTQDSQFCSVKTFESLYAPYYKKLNDWIHKNTSWKIFKHSCGAVEVFMESFIDSGFDIINPVQLSAKNMDPKNLKERYGDRIVFWGGGVDTQKTLPFGTPDQVREEVLRNCEIFSRNGGFVFNSVHNLQANVPVENVAAMIDAVHKFNK